MNVKSIARAFIGLVSVIASAFAAAAPIDLQFWHPALGSVDAALKKHVDAFNASQSEYRVVPTAHGTYDETFNAMIAAYRSGKQPHLVTAIGQETLTLQLSGAVYPVQDLMVDFGQKVDWSRYIQPIVSYYKSKEGKLMSLPFSASTPILWYNKDAFSKAGLTRPPETWDEVGDYATKLRAAGYPCAYGSGWQQWVHVDNYAFMQDLPVATQRNGMDGLNAEFVYNRSIVKHIAQIQSWVKDGRYEYLGRQSSSAIPAFISGRCAMVTTSSANFGSVSRDAKFAYGAAMMPIEAGGKAAGPSLIGGGSIWVLKGHKPADYKGLAAFLAYLSSPDVQATWHKDTGYLPSTQDAYDKVKLSGYYNEFPAQEIAIKQLLRGTATKESVAVRLGSPIQYVAVIEEELEFVWSNKKTAQEAMDESVKRGNEILRRFQRQNAGAGSAK